jgi:hypothetical protein
VGTTDRLGACFGKTEVPNLAFLDQLLDRTCHVFDGHLRIDAVLVEQIDHVALESLERSLGDLLDVLRLAVEAREGGEVEAELRGDHHLIPEGSKRFANELLISERAVDLGGVKEGDPAFHGYTDNGDRLLLIGSRAVGEAHVHATEPDGRNLQVAVSKFSFLHFEVMSVRLD